MTPDATNLCRRYADLLRTSGRCERTIDNYLYSLKGFARFLGECALVQAAAGDIVAYQIAVAARGKSDSCVRVATYAWRGFRHHVFGRDDWNAARLPRPCPRRRAALGSLTATEALLLVVRLLASRELHSPPGEAAVPQRGASAWSRLGESDAHAVVPANANARLG